MTDVQGTPSKVMLIKAAAAVKEAADTAVLSLKVIVSPPLIEPKFGETLVI